MSSSEGALDIEFPYVLEALLLEKNLKVLVKDIGFQDQLRNKGFGEKQDSEYVLQTYEALYLIHTSRLVLKTKKLRHIDFESLFTITLRHDREILTKFLIYRDLRSRGYVAKEGFGFGVDFRVYERGEFEKKPAKYVVFGINEGIQVKATEFSDALDQITKMGKNAVVAVIERRGEITYYKVSKVRFSNNTIHPKYPRNIAEE
ncbi:MAG TPA: tRNA-intron lyase [Candidatus Nitrosopolaris sp.]|nr:tRNA-intron lyase [Candidatus Nitrosopolaris sp.]